MTTKTDGSMSTAIEEAFRTLLSKHTMGEIKCDNHIKYIRLP